MNLFGPKRKFSKGDPVHSKDTYSERYVGIVRNIRDDDKGFIYGVQWDNARNDGH